MNTLDDKLREDAKSFLDRDKLAPLDERFHARLRATPQEPTIRTSEARVATWQWALPAVAAAMVVAYVVSTPERVDNDTDIQRAIVTPTEPPQEPLVEVETPAITPVDYEQALINEWEYIRNDISMTKEKIEEDLSIRF